MKRAAKLDKQEKRISERIDGCFEGGHEVGWCETDVCKPNSLANLKRIFTCSISSE